MKKHRIKRRLLQHHLPLLVFSVLCVGVFYRTVTSDDVLYRLSMATAYPGIALLAATLLTGPIKVLRSKALSLSDDLTRDLGIWAALMSVFHVVWGLQVHMRGRMWLLFVPENPSFPYVRLDMFGAANYTGLLGTIVVVVLLALSNDLSMRRLGSKKWKSLQRWNYGLFFLIVVHGVLYQVIEDRKLPYPYLFGAIGLVVIVLQIAGIIARKRRPVGTPG